jgi:hypothetical protein
MSIDQTEVKLKAMEASGKYPWLGPQYYDVMSTILSAPGVRSGDPKQDLKYAHSMAVHVLAEQQGR